MKTREYFLLCLVLTPIFAVMNDGAAGVVMLWGFFAYKAYMNYLRQKEMDDYIFRRDHMTYEDKRILAEWRERNLK